jgi:hypothetical protein
VGALIAIFAAIRSSSGSPAGWSWVNMFLGAWTFFSPWIFGYTASTGRFINSLCVGIAVFVISAFSAAVHPHITHTPTPPPLRT